MRPALALPIGLVAVALAAAPAGAQDAPQEQALDLELVITPGARHCPPEERLHRELSRRLGYDAFKPEGPSTPVGRLSVRIAADGNGLTATYSWTNPDGKSRWAKPKTFSEEGTDEVSCTDLYKGIAIGIIWEFPRGPRRPQPAAVQAVPVCAPAAVVPECPKAALPVVVEVKLPAKVEPVVAAPVAVPARTWSVEAGPWVDFGLAPAPMAGVKVGGAMRVGRWSVAGELRWDPPARPIAANGGGTIGATTSLFTSSVVGCLHGEQWRASFAGCLVGELGRIQRTDGIAMESGLQQAALYAGGGAGVRVQIPLLGRFEVHAAADLLAARTLASVARTRVSFAQGSVLGPAGGVGVGLGFLF